MAKRSRALIAFMSLAIVLPFYLSGPLMFIVLVSVMIMERRQIPLFIKNASSVFMFIAIVAVNSLWHRNEVGALVCATLAAFTMYFSCYQQGVTPDFYRRLLQLLSVGSLFAGAKAIWDYTQYILQNNQSVLYILQEASPKFRAESMFFNANYFGLYCIFIVMINLYLMTKAQAWQKRLLPLVSTIFMCVGMVLTASRMVYPTVLLAVVWYGFMLNRKLGRISIGVGLVAVMGIPSIIPRLSSIVYAFNDRFALWQTGWQIFVRSPLLGRGPFSYAKYYYLFDTKPTMHAHQLLIDTLANYGLLGLLLLTCLAIPLIRRISNEVATGNYRHEFALVTSMVLVVLIHGLTDVSIFWLQTGYIFLLVILPPFAKMFEDRGNA